jgi:hypothetical protein
MNIQFSHFWSWEVQNQSAGEFNNPLLGSQIAVILLHLHKVEGEGYEMSFIGSLILSQGLSHNVLLTSQSPPHTTNTCEG